GHPPSRPCCGPGPLSVAQRSLFTIEHGASAVAQHRDLALPHRRYIDLERAPITVASVCMRARLLGKGAPSPLAVAGGAHHRLQDHLRPGPLAEAIDLECRFPNFWCFRPHRPQDLPALEIARGTGRAVAAHELAASLLELPHDKCGPQRAP